MAKNTVLIVGASGKTGSSIVDALLASPEFNVIAAVRPGSLSSPSAVALGARGVEIRPLDLEHSSHEQLTAALKDVDTVISTIVWTALQSQRILIEASKKTGVKRFIPCDWGTACVRGVRKLYDEKAEIQDFIKELGLAYTFIDVGWWYQLTLPFLDPAKAFHPMLLESTKQKYGSGDVKFAVTDKRDIGKFVARIINDPRTLNRYVFCWGEEVSQNEVFALAERISGQKIPVVHHSEEEVYKLVKEAQDINSVNLEYQLSIHIRGDDTVENAKKEEYGNALDARELYPDLKVISLEEYAEEFYS